MNIRVNSPPSCLRYYHSVKALDSKEKLCDKMSRTLTISFRDHTSPAGHVDLHSESINIKENIAIAELGQQSSSSTACHVCLSQGPEVDFQMRCTFMHTDSMIKSSDQISCSESAQSAQR